MTLIDFDKASEFSKASEVMVRTELGTHYGTEASEIFWFAKMFDNVIHES